MNKEQGSAGPGSFIHMVTATAGVGMKPQEEPRRKLAWNHKKSPDVSVRGNKHKNQTFQKQLHLHHEALRTIPPAKSRICLGLKTKFGEAFSFSSESNE